MGSPYCRKAAKESVVSAAWTPVVTRLKRELGRPVRILKVMGLRSDKGPDRARSGPPSATSRPTVPASSTNGCPSRTGPPPTSRHGTSPRPCPTAGHTTPCPAPATGQAHPAAPAPCVSTHHAVTLCSPPGDGRGWQTCTPRSSRLEATASAPTGASATSSGTRGPAGRPTRVSCVPTPDPSSPNSRRKDPDLARKRGRAVTAPPNPRRPFLRSCTSPVSPSRPQTLINLMRLEPSKEVPWAGRRPNVPVPPHESSNASDAPVRSTSKGILAVMTTSTQRLLDLAAAAAASHDEDFVLLLLIEASGL